MPASMVKPGQEKQWQKAKQLASDRGHADDYAYIVGIFQKLTHVAKAMKVTDLAGQHTQTGKTIPLPVAGIERMDPKAVGGALAKRLKGWGVDDHHDASSSHMQSFCLLRDGSSGLMDTDAAKQRKQAARFLRMSDAHLAAAEMVRKRVGRSREQASNPKEEGAKFFSGGNAVELAKSTGAGSRGGHIISYTGSGRAIYEPGHGHTVGYSKKDHHEAGLAHMGAAKMLMARKDEVKGKKASELSAVISRHLDTAQAHFDIHSELEAADQADAPPPEPQKKPEIAEEAKPDTPKKGHKYKSRTKVDGKWVYEYDKPAAPPKPKKADKAPSQRKKKVVPAEDETPPAKPKDDPDRQEAAADLKDDTEYAYARDSDFANKGEDLKLSARHKVNAWRGWEDAEKQGTAKELVKRDVLMKVEPLDYMAAIESGKPLSALVAYLALKKFPAAPTHTGVKRVSGTKAADDAEIADLWENDKGETRITYRRYNGTFDAGSHPTGFAKHVGPLTKNGMEARNRGAYVAAFTVMTQAAKNVMSDSTDENWTLQPMREAARDIMQRLRATDRYSDTANSLVKMVNTGLRTDGYKAKHNSIQADLKKLHEYLSQYPDAQRPAAMVEAIKQIVGGKSIDEAFKKTTKSDGTKVAKPKEFTAADAYVAYAKREGPALKGVANKEQQEKTLLTTMGIRGLQWGNSVTDGEREHHLKQSAMAFDDLADVLDLPKKMVSFNNRLGLAIGARGRASAMAHYEPSMRVINLTRKNGVGSLAHEWGHFFDNICSELVAHRRDNYLTDDARRYAIPGARVADHPVTQAMAELYASPVMQGFKRRLINNLNTKYAETISPKKAAYWCSTIEIWARCFERHVQTKLQDKDRENTYLTGSTNRDLWPTDEESKALAPYFDKVFESFKASDLVNKALRLLDGRIFARIQAA